MTDEVDKDIFIINFRQGSIVSELDKIVEEG